MIRNSLAKYDRKRAKAGQQKRLDLKPERKLVRKLSPGGLSVRSAAICFAWPSLLGRRSFWRCSSTLLHDHLCMDFFQFRGFDFLGPKQRHKPDKNGSGSNNVDNEEDTHDQRYFFHFSASSPAAFFCFTTWSIRRPIAPRESLRIATFFSRGMSSPESLRSFNCFLTGRSSSLVAASSIDGLEKIRQASDSLQTESDVPFIRRLGVGERRCRTSLAFP